MQFPSVQAPVTFGLSIGYISSSSPMKSRRAICAPGIGRDNAPRGDAFGCEVRTRLNFPQNVASRGAVREGQVL